MEGSRKLLLSNFPLRCNVQFESLQNGLLHDHWLSEEVELAGLPHFLLLGLDLLQVGSQDRDQPFGSLLMKVLVDGAHSC